MSSMLRDRGGKSKVEQVGQVAQCSIGSSKERINVLSWNQTMLIHIPLPSYILESALATITPT
jgi:hypothetical protein